MGKSYRIGQFLLSSSSPFPLLVETASRRYFKGKNVSTLLYLARSWYHKANKDQSFADLRASLVAIEAVRPPPSPQTSPSILFEW